MLPKKKIGFISCILILLLTVILSYKCLSGNQYYQKLSIGERFHQETSLTWQRVLGDIFKRLPESPPLFKYYPGAKLIRLPKPMESNMPLKEAILKRRSIRTFSSKAMDIKQLSNLLFAAQGITGSLYDRPLRTAPSAGALYPFEIYVVVNNVQDLSPGIYHYHVLKHALELVKLGDFRNEVTSAGLKQEMLGEAEVTFILASIFDRVRCKYGERGFRYVYIEAGHISQNIYLQATSLGLGSVCVGAFLDENVNKLIGVDGHKEAVIYMHAVGTL